MLANDSSTAVFIQFQKVLKTRTAPVVGICRLSSVVFSQLAGKGHEFGFVGSGALGIETPNFAMADRGQVNSLPAELGTCF